MFVCCYMCRQMLQFGLVLHGLVLWLPFALLVPVFEYAHKNLRKWRVVAVVIVGTNQRLQQVDECHPDIRGEC